MGRLSYLLDSNVVSEAARPRPDPAVDARLRTHRDAIGIAAPVLHELRYGLLRLPDGKRKRKLTAYMQQVVATLPVLSYDREAAQWHAEERARLVGQGRTPSFVDSQIAAIAAVNGLTLVTRNTADFADFAELRLDNWFTARTDG